MDQDKLPLSDINDVGAISNSEAITEAVTTGEERESGHPDPFFVILEYIIYEDYPEQG